jgi:hypothetical protein
MGKILVQMGPHRVAFPAEDVIMVEEGYDEERVEEILNREGIKYERSRY